MRLLDAIEELRLKMASNAELNTLVTGIFDGDVPAGQSGPYCVVGPAKESKGRLIMDSERRGVARVSIWGDGRGNAEVLGVFDALDRAVASDFFHFKKFKIVSDEPNGWMRGIVTYEFYYNRRNEE